MTSFLKKMFNKGEGENEKPQGPNGQTEKASATNSSAKGSSLASSTSRAGDETAFDVVKNLLEQVIQHADFHIDFSLKEVADGLEINFYGEDEDLFTFRSGQVMDAVQLLLKRAVDRHWPEDKIRFYIDTNEFKKNNKDSILSTVERLKGMAVDQNKPMYTKTYLPKDRKLIHQHLNDDADVRSRSVGEGLYKKVKIYPANLYESEQH